MRVGVWVWYRWWRGGVTYSELILSIYQALQLVNLEPSRFLAPKPLRVSVCLSLDVIKFVVLGAQRPQVGLKASVFLLQFQVVLLQLFVADSKGPCDGARLFIVIA
jgi:hypothetical protein